MPIWKAYFLAPLSVALFLLFALISSCTSDQAEAINGIHPLMGAGYGISSSTLIVKDLKKVQEYYSEVLGFDMSRSGEPKPGAIEGSLGISIRFPDMSAIKLLSVADSAEVTDKNSFITAFLEQHEGVRMYALSSSSIDTTAEWLTAQGFQTDSIDGYRISTESPKGWARDDGGPQILSVGFEDTIPPAYLPRFEELTDFPYERMHEWESYYNMQRGFFQHPNGVVGIAALHLVVDDIEAAKEEFLKVGLQELAGEPSENLVRFKIKRNQELQLRSPQSPDDELSKFLRDRGPGVFGMSFEVKDIQATYDSLKAKLPEDALFIDSLPNSLTVLQEHAYGVRLEFQQEPAEQAKLAEELNLNFASSLDSVARQNAASMYAKYCALCHGENREGYAADFAPSLRSHSLLASSKGSNFLRYTIQYGRAGTAMAGYYKEQGGPLGFLEIELLLKWLEESSGVEEPIELSRDPVAGDAALGSAVYAKHCATCHGENGEGISAPALGNPMLLATATDDFLRYAIKEGRDSTLMPAFKDSLSSAEIDGVTAFLRSRASGWNVPKGDTINIPLPENYVLNPDRAGPNFDLRDGRYVSAEQLNKALEDSVRIVLLDARSEVAWRQTHIPGAIPVPYYQEPEEFVEHIPNDSTWVVAYCACPHAASGKVINTLNRYGYKNTAILDEGILVWAQLGYPVLHGQ